MEAHSDISHPYGYICIVRLGVNANEYTQCLPFRYDYGCGYTYESECATPRHGLFMGYIARFLHVFFYAFSALSFSIFLSFFSFPLFSPLRSERFTFSFFVLPSLFLFASLERTTIFPPTQYNLRRKSNREGRILCVQLSALSL